MPQARAALSWPVLSQVEFSPTLQTLASVVNDIGNHLFSTISVFRHLPDILMKRKMTREPIHVLVGEWAGTQERPGRFPHTGPATAVAHGKRPRGEAEEGAGTGRGLQVT